MQTTQSAALLLESGLIDEMRAKAGEQRAADRAAELLKLAEIARRESEELPTMAAALLAAVTRRQELDREIEAANTAIREAGGPLNNLQCLLSHQREVAENRIRHLADPRIHKAIEYTEELRRQVRASLSTWNEAEPGFTGIRQVKHSNVGTCNRADAALLSARHKLEAMQLEPLPNGLDAPMRAIWQPLIDTLKPLRIKPDLAFLDLPPAPASNWLERIFNSVKEKA
jgi:hypothetical protein